MRTIDEDQPFAGRHNTPAGDCDRIPIEEARRRQFPTVVAFFNWHLQTFWMFPKVDGYLVATERQAQALITCGIPHQIVAQVGILVDEWYYGDQDQMEYRRMIGVPEHDPSLLVMSGGTAWRMEDFVKVICQLKCAATVYIVGVSDLLKPQLELLIRNQLRGPITVRLLGYTDARPYFRAVDAVLTKPGVSVAEGFAIGIPTIWRFRFQVTMNWRWWNYWHRSQSRPFRRSDKGFSSNRCSPMRLPGNAKRETNQGEPRGNARFA